MGEKSLSRRPTLPPQGPCAPLPRDEEPRVEREQTVTLAPPMAPRPTGGVSWDDQAVGRQHRRRGSVGGAANMATAWCWCWACERSAKCEVERWGPGP